MLDTLPNGFPETESGVEIKLLKRILLPLKKPTFLRVEIAL
jgi:hypothetical protein